MGETLFTKKGPPIFNILFFIDNPNKAWAKKRAARAGGPHRFFRVMVSHAGKERVSLLRFYF